MKHKEAIEILQEQLNLSTHLQAYPQDAYKNDPTRKIDVLIRASENHRERCEKLKQAIQLLINDEN